MSLIAIPFRIAGLCRHVASACRSVYAELRDPYRPELHYMRGPGPKWSERHVVGVGAKRP